MVRIPLGPEELARGREIGSILRAARGERTMVGIATAAGISPETLRKIETGRIATPAFSTIAAIASVLHLSLDDLWATVDTRVDASIDARIQPASDEPGYRRAS